MYGYVRAVMCCWWVDVRAWLYGDVEGSVIEVGEPMMEWVGGITGAGITDGSMFAVCKGGAVGGM